MKSYCAVYLSNCTRRLEFCAALDGIVGRSRWSRSRNYLTYGERRMIWDRQTYSVHVPRLFRFGTMRKEKIQAFPMSGVSGFSRRYSDQGYKVETGSKKNRLGILFLGGIFNGSSYPMDFYIKYIPIIANLEYNNIKTKGLFKSFVISTCKCKGHWGKRNRGIQYKCA